MITVALIGADGAGKTTIGRRLQEEQPQRFKYIYMGINTEASNLVFPTTRLLQKYKRTRGIETDMGGPPDRTSKKARPKGIIKQMTAALKSSLRLINRLAEEWFRQAAAWFYQRQGYVVLFDRHFYSDFYAHDIVDNGSDRPLTRRVHGYILKHFYPKPDLVILLDAPADVLFARKHEGTPELLETRRQEYLQLGDKLDNFVIVDVNQPQEIVLRKVAAAIQEFYELELVDRSEASNAHVS